MKTKILFGLMLSLLLTTPGHAQSFDRAKLDQFFDRLAEKNKAMGSLAIAKDGVIQYERAIGYGRIDAAEKTPLTTSHRFRIGSITKMFTAVMIFQLDAEGKLKLTDKLATFYPQIPNAEKITIAQILGHRSGIHDAILDPKLRPASNQNFVSKEELLAIVARGTPDFEPDTKSVYSNSGYFVLGLILEKVTGKSYAENLEARITSRIGLKDTYVATGNIDVSKKESLTYIFTGSEWKQGPETHPSILFGGGQIISTPRDLATFIKALFDLKLVSRDNLERMKTLRDGEGIGMERFTFGGRTYYGHTGGGDNYGAWVAYQPEEKVAMAYTTNAKVYPVADIMKGITDIYYNVPYEIPAFAIVTVAVDLLDRYVGVYANPNLPNRFTVTREGTTLFVQPGKETPVSLEAIAQDRFQLGGGRIIFEFDAATKQMTLKRGGPPLVFTKEN